MSLDASVGMVGVGQRAAYVMMCSTCLILSPFFLDFTHARSMWNGRSAAMINVSRTRSNSNTLGLGVA